jgi:hypothetical protein
MVAIGNVATRSVHAGRRERPKADAQQQVTSTIGSGGLTSGGYWEDISTQADSIVYVGTRETNVGEISKFAVEDRPWVGSDVEELAPISGISPTQDQTSFAEFQELVSRWEQERPRGADLAEMVTQPAYLRIIGRGPQIVPFLLGELARKPRHWFWALHIITGADPVKPGNEGKLQDMVADWLAWGKEQGYSW